MTSSLLSPPTESKLISIASDSSVFSELAELAFSELKELLELAFVESAELEELVELVEFSELDTEFVAAHPQRNISISNIQNAFFIKYPLLRKFATMKRH